MELDLRLHGPLADAVLDARSDEIMEAIEQHASDIALGPALALNFHECAVKLQFDVIAATATELHRKLATLLAIVEREADFPIASLSTTAEFTEVDSRL